MKVTIFNTLYDKKPRYTDVSDVFEKIKSSPVLKGHTEKLRELATKDEIDEAKKSLPICLFAGSFSERRNSAIKTYSRLVILDFDKLEDKYGLFSELSKNPNILAVWESPSGTGLKAVVLVSSDDYAGHVKALLHEFPLADKACKDVARATFLSFDPEIFTKEAIPYTKVIKDAYSDQQKYDNLKKWLENKGEKFVNGNRNNFIAKLAGAMNRFGLSIDFAKDATSKDFCGGDFSQREGIAVIDRIYNLYPEQFGSASFDNPITPEQEDTYLSTTVEVHDTIYLGDVREDLLRTYDEGIDKAPSTFFPSIDEIFRPQPGDLNVLIGIGNMGKSQWQKQLDLIQAVKIGGKSAWFGPEEYPPHFWYRELIRSHVGKPLEKEDPKRMTRKEYELSMEFIREHFFYVYPPELPTPEYIIERFAELIIKHGVTRITIDPFNQLNHLMQKRDDIYLAECLTKFERFAQQHGVYFTVIAHPNRTQKDEQGNYKAPDIYDINGGPVWNARSTNITCYHRPFYGVDKSDPTCEISSKKIKRQMISGIPGTTVLTYDRRTGRFFDNGYNPLS
jgi:hypothetical protein